MKRFDTTVAALEPVARDYFRMDLHWDDGAGLPSPGTFLTVRAGTPGRAGYDPSLRRPFAFSARDPGRGTVSFVFQLRGRGTAWLASLGSGAALDVMGPLGRGFSPPRRGFRPVLVAGGIGLGPMLFLARSLGEAARRGECEAPVLALGFRSAEYAPTAAADLPEGTVICTDDGSSGFRGTVGDWLAAFDPGSPPEYYACGPAPMMAAVDRIASARGATWQAATEAWMACGVGACMGCAIPLKGGGYARACADGPVLDGGSVDWGRA